MFLISMPTTFTVGETADCQINGKPARVTWRDIETLVIEPGDARKIICTIIEGDRKRFLCTPAGVGMDDMDNMDNMDDMDNKNLIFNDPRDPHGYGQEVPPVTQVGPFTIGFVEEIHGEKGR